MPPWIQLKSHTSGASATRYVEKMATKYTGKSVIFKASEGRRGRWTSWYKGI